MTRSSADLRPVQRATLLVLAFAGLVVGVGAGLARLGWSVPAVAASAAALHAPLMVGAFLGAVISLERAVAIGRRWAYLGPLFAGLGGSAAIAGAAPVASWLLAAGSIVLLAASIDIFRRQRALFTFTLVLGAACWTVGNFRWSTGAPVRDIVTWWLAFPILTIAAERLELSRFLPPSPSAKGAFALILVALSTGPIAAPRDWGAQVFAAGLLALSAWLVKQDIARRTVRRRGITRFIALCLLSGYAWLAVGGVVIIVSGGLVPGSPSYDAALHALALGFVFAMIFGHAPIIFPAVMRVRMPYHRTFYAPLGLLHLSLAIRLAGDVFEQYEWTRMGGLLNALALAAFLASTVTAIARGSREGGPLEFADTPAATDDRSKR